MKRFRLIAYTILLFVTSHVQAQQEERLRVLFYNVENLFDCHDDSLKMDDEFLPTGKRRWHQGRMNTKLKNLARVIVAAGEWEAPALVGLCEVESDSALLRLTRYTPLRELGYRYVITDSPDERGINVALLYRRHQFKLLNQRSHHVNLSHLKRKPTRDILHVEGLLLSGDTLDLLVCHFPSRSGGVAESNAARLCAANVARGVVDSLYLTRQNPLILLMGDLNDQEESATLRRISEGNKEDSSPMIRLIPQNNRFGTYSYQGEWEEIDHLFASKNLLNKTNSAHILTNDCTIFDANFLLKVLPNGGGFRPFRTYLGWKYEGGFSDHLPIYTDLRVTWE